MFANHAKVIKEKQGRKLTGIELEEVKKQTIKAASKIGKPPKLP
ncbi:MAG: hypothetical protein ABUK01_04255 [Leptospirales bacterium]